MAYINIELTFQNIDREPKKMIIGPFRTNAPFLNNLKTNIKTFNTTTEEQVAWYNSVGINGKGLLMQGQYPNVPIIEAAIITTNETDVMTQ